MSEYVGMICPFCRTEIEEGESVKVCPECNIPHHANCWIENKGCTTFGCSEQNYEVNEESATGNVEADKANTMSSTVEKVNDNVCKKCGFVMADGQDFCPKCGEAKVPKKNVCSRCNNELIEGQEFCPKCGNKVTLEDNKVVAAIEQLNNVVKTKNKAGNKKILTIAILAVVCLVIGIVAFKIIGDKRAEAAKAEYIATARQFTEETLDAGTNLEEIADTIQKYWYENIWEDKHGSSIDSAILYALIDKESEIEQAKVNDVEVKRLYNELKTIPDEISDEDMDEIEEIRDCVKDLYNVYTEYYDMAMNPSGSYNSFSDANASKTDDFISAYKALDNLLD